MKVLNPLRVDPHFLQVVVDNEPNSGGRGNEFRVILRRDGVEIKSERKSEVLIAARDLIQRTGLPWVALLVIGTGWTLAGVLGDERECSDCNGAGQVTLFSTTGNCRACEGRGTLLSVPADLPVVAIRL